METGTTVGIRELRQNLSKYVERVKAGEALIVTERGVEVARLVPSGRRRSTLAFLVEELGTTVPQGSMKDLPPLIQADPGAPSTEEILDDMRQERL